MALPLPSVVPNVEAGGGIATSMRGLNALTESALRNKIMEAEAAYAPYNAYANAASKIAYSNFVGPQALAALFKDPLIRGSMDPQTQARLGQAITQQLSGANTNALANLPAPGSNMGMGGGLPLGMGGGLLTTLLAPMLRNMFQQQQPNAVMQQPMQQSMQPTNALTQPTQPQPMGAPPQPTQIGYETPASTQVAEQTPPGTVGATSPYISQQAQEKATERKIVGQTETENKLREARTKQFSQQSIIASNALKSLEGFHRNYKESKYKGQYLGSRPSSGQGSIPTLPGHNQSPEQLTDNYQNQFLNDLASLGDTPAGQTDMAREMIKSAKVHRALDPDAEQELYEQNKAKLKRLKLLRQFATLIYRNNPNITDDDLVGLMNEYNEYAPPYDYEKGRSIPENDKKFKDFASKEALDFYKKHAYFNPYDEDVKQELKSIPTVSQQTQTQPKGKVIDTRMDSGKKYIKLEDGQWYEEVG